MKKAIADKEFNEQLGKFIEDHEAKNLPNHINFEAIKHLRAKGKDVRAVMMKNNLVAYVVQNPLWHYYENGDIDHKLFAVGVAYSRDYSISIQDNMAKQAYDGTGISSQTFSKSNKEPSQRQIDAFKRLYAVKRELDRKSHYPIPKKRVHNKRYTQILELFLEQEIGIAAIKERMNLGHYKIKERIIEALEIAEKVYKKHECHKI